MEGRGLAEGEGRTGYSENRTRQTNEEIRRRKVQINRTISFIPCLGFACVTETLYVLPPRNREVCFVLTVAKLHVLYKYTQTVIFTRFKFLEPCIVIYLYIIRSHKMHTSYISVLIELDCLRRVSNIQVFFQLNQPTRCSNFSRLLLVI
jgi:hypothetical protein